MRTSLPRAVQFLAAELARLKVATCGTAKRWPLRSQEPPQEPPQPRPTAGSNVAAAPELLRARREAARHRRYPASAASDPFPGNFESIGGRARAHDSDSAPV